MSGAEARPGLSGQTTYSRDIRHFLLYHQVLLDVHSMLVYVHPIHTHCADRVGLAAAMTGVHQ